MLFEEIMHICHEKLAKADCDRNQLRWELGGGVARCLVNRTEVRYPRDEIMTLLGIGVDVNPFDPWCLKLWREVE